MANQRDEATVQEVRSDAASTENEIEGGFVDALEEPPFNEPKHRAVTAQRLAMLFAWILAGSLVVHYACFMVLALTAQKESLEPLGRIFNVWLPALTGIVSSAATYYFSKER